VPTSKPVAKIRQSSSLLPRSTTTRTRDASHPKTTMVDGATLSAVERLQILVVKDGRFTSTIPGLERLVGGAIATISSNSSPISASWRSPRVRCRGPLRAIHRSAVSWRMTVRLAGCRHFGDQIFSSCHSGREDLKVLYPACVAHPAVMCLAHCESVRLLAHTPPTTRCSGRRRLCAAAPRWRHALVAVAPCDDADALARQVLQLLAGVAIVPALV